MSFGLIFCSDFYGIKFIWNAKFRSIRAIYFVFSTVQVFDQREPRRPWAPRTLFRRYFCMEPSHVTWRVSDKFRSIPQMPWISSNSSGVKCSRDRYNGNIAPRVEFWANISKGLLSQHVEASTWFFFCFHVRAQHKQRSTRLYIQHDKQTARTQDPGSEEASCTLGKYFSFEKMTKYF